MENLNGRYGKALKDHPWGIPTIKAGDYFKFIDTTSSGKCIDDLKKESYWSWSNIPDSVEIMPLGFNLNNIERESKSSNFISGGWYKGNRNNNICKYYKILKLENDNIATYSESIEHSGKYKMSSSRSTIGNFSEFTKVALEEIQAYLPEGHPDRKINKSMESLLEEARKRYSIGTNFISPHTGNIETVHSKGFYGASSGIHGDSILAYIERTKGYSGEYVFYDNKWAEIVGEKEKIYPVVPGKYYLFKIGSNTNLIKCGSRMVDNYIYADEWVLNYKEVFPAGPNSRCFASRDIKNIVEIAEDYFRSYTTRTQSDFPKGTGVDLATQKQTAFNEQEFLSSPFNKELELNIKQQSKKKTKLQL